MEAPNINAAQERISELVWRTIKLRVTLLIVSLVGILITWSALSGGDEHARQIEQKYCRQIVASENASFPQPQIKVGPVNSASIDPDVWCTQSGARNYIESFRATNEMLSAGFLGSISTESLEKLYREHIKLLGEYDAERQSH